MLILTIGLFIALVLLRLVIDLIQWQPQQNLNMAWVIITGGLAVFSGTLSLVRFYTRKDAVYLFIGIGFLGAGLFNSYQLYLQIDSQQMGTALNINWQISSVFLSILLAGSWLVWFRGQGFSSLQRRFLWGATAVLLINIIYFAGVTGLPDFDMDYNLYTAVAVAATFFLLALLGYVQKHLRQADIFENWLIAALVMMYGSQSLFMVFAASPQDAMFVWSQALQSISYLCVLIGLLINMVHIFRTAEVMAKEQIIFNEALQREVAERIRIEAAEYEQRELAEALREVGIALSSVLEFKPLLDLLLDQIARVMPYDTANVMLVHGDEIEMSVNSGYNKDKQPGVPEKFRINRMPSLQRMLDTEEPVIVPDTRNHELWVNPEDSPHVRSWAGAPIVVNGEVIAFLALNNSEPFFYSPQDAERLSAFAAQAAVAFQNANLFEEASRRADELASLNEIGQAISSSLDLEEILNIITQSTVRLLGVEAASLVLLDEEENYLRFAAASGEAADFVYGQRLELGQGIIGWAVANGESVLVPDTFEDGRYFSDFDEKSGFLARSILCIPLITKGETIGAIEAINKIEGPFNQEDLKLLTRLVQPAATAIENAQLFAKAQLEIAERTRVQKALDAERELLARRVDERTADLSAANAELARAARLKDEFLASMSHELRTPLNAVLGISEALQEEVYGALNENQRSSLHSIGESGRHLLSLINDILDLSKIEAGKLELDLLPIGLETVCQASLRIIKQNAHKKRLTVHFSFDNSVSTIQADERRVKQILVNLLSNAVKFTPEGGEIGLDVVGDEETGQVLITVWDSGIGISEEGMARLFEPFVQLDSRLAREFGGTGLGLSLVQRMMDLHGGSVSVESEIGEGSRFTVAFPWQGAKSKAATAKNGQVSSLKLSSIFPVAMVVDDSPAARAQLKRYLKELGIEVLVNENGENLIMQAVSLRPNIIFLDILLPHVSGWDKLADLKANEKTRDIPVVIASVIDERENALAAGAVDCLLKPVTRQQLDDVLHRIVSLPQAVAEPVQSSSRLESATTAVRPRILLAEDNQANVTTFTHYLTAKGYDIIVADNGREAIEQAKKEKPDLILMDIQMPQVNGLEAIKTIRADDAVRDIPIIAVTALAMPGDLEQCLEAGANDYLSKPVSLKGLLERIQAQLMLGGKS